MKKQLILLGAPGSGKGTQAAKIIDEFSYNHVSTGDLLRSEIASKSELGLRVKSIMDAGNLVDDSTVLELLKNNCDVQGKVYIFDGYPRNIEQAKALEDNILKGTSQVAIYFDVDFGKLIERIINRRSCTACGSIYNILINSEAKSGKCPSCGGELKHRADDQEDVVKNRIEVFKNTIIPVRDFYSEAGMLEVVDANADVDSIFSKISKILS